MTDDTAEAPADRLHGTVLSVWAHPDDESYLAAGLMSLAVRDGQRVVCVTATRGELGSTDADRWPPGPSLAAVRTQEMAAALAAIGVTEHHWLDFPDGGCDAVPDEQGAARIRAIMAEVRPDTVVTFGPDGQTGHPDHIAVGRWVGIAADTLPDGVPAPRVLHSRGSAEFLAEFGGDLAAAGAFIGDHQPVTLPLAEMDLAIVLDEATLSMKFDALQAQVSQTGPLLMLFGPQRYREFLRTESYVDRLRDAAP